MSVGIDLGNYKFKNAMVGNLKNSCVLDLVILDIH